MRIFFVNRWSGEIYTRIGYWLPANFLLNGLWIIAFTQEWVFLSVIIIIGLLLTLIVIYFKINRLDFRWYDRLPFSIYLAGYLLLPLSMYLHGLYKAIPQPF